jgi:nucleoside-diphosphate-sugar epimerase
MVFLTGITGLVGNYIAEYLLNQGYQVKALIRKGTDTSLLNPVIELIEGDLLDPLLLNKSISGCEYVIHCAAIVSFSSKMINEMMLVNIEGTKNIVNASLLNQVKKLIHISSIAAIGRDTKSDIITENTAWVDSEMNTNYAKSKYLSELEVWRGVEEGLNTIILNPSVILGIGNWNKSSSKLFKYIFDEKPFYTKGNINVVDVRDVALIAVNAITNSRTNERYIISNTTLTYKELFDALAIRLNKKSPSILVTPLMAAIAWRFEWIKALFTQKEPLVNKETAQQSHSSYVYLNEKVINHFDYKFITLDQTLDWSCQNYLNNSQKH